MRVLSVLASHRRRQVGTAFVREADARLKSMGRIKINLQVRVSNEAVAAFCKRLGYAIEERISMAKVIGRTPA